MAPPFGCPAVSGSSLSFEAPPAHVGSEPGEERAHHRDDVGVVTAKLCILAIGALHPDSALSSDTQRADFLQKTYFVESPSFGMRLPGLLPEDSSL